MGITGILRQLEIIQNIEQDAAFNDMTVEMILEMLR
jgi:hypothetical protein